MVKPRSSKARAVSRRVLLDLRQGGAWRDEALAHQGGGVPGDAGGIFWQPLKVYQAIRGIFYMLLISLC